MNQVHKEQLNQIDNALPNRANLDVEIFGMEGIPEDVTQAHNQRVLSNYAQAEAERRAVTGNPAPGGSSQGSAPKKPKFESPSEMKKRLAEHKAKKAAEEAAAANAPQNGAGVLQAEGNGPPSPAFGQAPYVSSHPHLSILLAHMIGFYFTVSWPTNALWCTTWKYSVWKFTPTIWAA